MLGTLGLVHSHFTNLQVLHLWEPRGDGGEQVVVEVELSETLDVVQPAVLDTTDPVVAEAQPVRA